MIRQNRNFGLIRSVILSKFVSGIFSLATWSKCVGAPRAEVGPWRQKDYPFKVIPCGMSVVKQTSPRGIDRNGSRQPQHVCSPRDLRRIVATNGHNYDRSAKLDCVVVVGTRPKVLF